MQTKNKSSIKQAIENFIADKPMLVSQFEKFEKPEEEDIFIYAAFTGSVHEPASRARKQTVQ